MSYSTRQWIHRQTFSSGMKLRLAKLPHIESRRLGIEDITRLAVFRNVATHEQTVNSERC